MNSRTSLSASKTTDHLNGISSRSVLDAFIFHSNDTSVFINLRNLLTFFLDLITSDITKETNQIYFQQIESCISHLKTYLYNSTFSADKEILKTLNELLEECAVYQSTLKSFSETISSCDFELQGLLIAKSTQIQWLGVCLLEDIKKNLPVLKY